MRPVGGSRTRYYFDEGLSGAYRRFLKGSQSYLESPQGFQQAFSRFLTSELYQGSVMGLFKRL